jgi:hypothetical protein
MTIKKISLVVLTVLLSANIYCQWDQNPDFKIPSDEIFSPQDTSNHNNNVLYLSGSFAPISAGLRYEHYFNRVAPYICAMVGKAPGGDNITNQFYKFIVGGAYRLTYRRDEIDSPIASIGLIYHYWVTEDLADWQYNPYHGFRKWSFEMGMGGRIGRFNVAGRADFMQMEVNMDLGFNF